MTNERENFRATQQQRYFRSINWSVHRPKYKDVLERTVSAKVSAGYWETLYVSSSDDDRLLSVRLGNHPFDFRSNRFRTELGGALSISLQPDGRVLLIIIPCHVEGESPEPIFLGVYDDPSLVTESVLQRAVGDFFRVVRVTSVLLSAGLQDRIRVNWLRFRTKYPGHEKLHWAARNWPAFALGTVLSGLGIYLSVREPSTDDLIRLANPTDLRIAAAGLVWWSGDDQQFLTLTLINTSSLSALNPKACFLRTSTCEQIASSRGIMDAPKGATLTIDRSQTMKFPIMSEHEVIQYVREQSRSSAKILGWGLVPEVPGNLAHSCSQVAIGVGPCETHLGSVGIPVRVEWDTTFGEEKSLSTFVYAYIEHESKKTSQPSVTAG